MWIGSCEFWLFPNLFDDQKGVVDSFIPAVTFSVREGDSFATKFARLACLGLLIYVTYSVIKEPKIITSVSDASFRGVADILEWGQLRLGGGNASEEIPPAKKTLEEIEQELNKTGATGGSEKMRTEAPPAAADEEEEDESDPAGSGNGDDKI